MLEALAFYIFAAVTLVSAIGVVASRNIVRSAVCLLGTLGGVACLYFLLNANLLAAIQLIVYAGGTLILIVFGVMLTSKSPWVVFDPTRGQVVGAVIVSILLATGLCMLLVGNEWPAGTAMTASPHVKDVGTMLLTDYLVPFEAASVLLLVVMIGAAYLARPEK
ncbi:MAG: NADH-quinone oxidoreductase subunit J [Planctomycetes bacterium]|nr:NADH-quinone oxidoreductase subunit J [Planctomycetota bacterium]